MKRTLLLFVLAVLYLAIPQAQAHPSASVQSDRLAAALATRVQSQSADSLSVCDSHGTPLVLKLARQGDVKTLLHLAENAPSGQFLFAKDRYGNNIFHVAKNADTLQAAAALIRRFFSIQAAQTIRQLVNTPNTLGETPLYAQINAAHADTFRTVYTYSSLKQKNDSVTLQISRLRGMDERIIRQHKEIYCSSIVEDATVPGGKTILQSAQDQVTYNPQMIRVVQEIKRTLPCLSQI